MRKDLREMAGAGPDSESLAAPGGFSSIRISEICRAEAKSARKIQTAAPLSSFAKANSAFAWKLRVYAEHECPS